MLTLSPLRTEDSLNEVAGIGNGYESKYIQMDCPCMGISFFTE